MKLVPASLQTAVVTSQDCRRVQRVAETGTGAFLPLVVDLGQTDLCHCFQSLFCVFYIQSLANVIQQLN